MLDDYGATLAEEYPSSRTERLNDVFEETFGRIAEAAGDDFFRRFYPDENRFKGPFLNTSFEALASAVEYRLLRGLDVASDLLEKARELWGREELSTRFATGRSTEWRIATYVPLGRELLAP